MDPTTNFGITSVSIGYDETALEIVMSTGGGAKFPDPDVDGQYNLIWWNASDYSNAADDPKKELVRVTGPAGTDNTKTILRGQEGTAASTKNESGKVYKLALPFTKLNYDLIKTAVERIDQDVTIDSSPQFNIENMTIPNDYIKDGHIDWGVGANQVSSSDIPDHDEHTIRDTFIHVVNRGVSSAITINLTGGLNFSWTAGEIYDIANHTFVTTDAGSGSVTDNAVNYLKWISGTTLTVSTSDATGNEVLVATGSTYDGNINGYREMSLLDESLANIRRCARAVFPTRVISGMSVHEDTDATNPLDVTMDAGCFCKEIQEGITPIEIKSRNTAMVRHFHTASVWDSDTNAQIETTNYDNGTQKTAIPSNKWVKGLFIYMNGKIGFVYPTEYFSNKAEAEEATLPVMPTGLEPTPKLTAIVYQQGASTFATAVWQDVRAGISEQAFGGVSDHGALSNLAWASSGHSGDVSTFAGFDGAGVATYYTEADYLLADGSRAFTGQIQRSASNDITAHAGGGQADAVIMSGDINEISVCATAGDSVKLTNGDSGKKIVVINHGAEAMDLFPATGNYINEQAINIATSIAINKTAICYCWTTSKWEVVEVGR